MAILTLTLIYATVKLTHLIGKQNPNINIVTIPNYYAPENRLNLNDANFRMAFTVENVLGKKRRKDNPKYVKYVVQIQ